MQLWQVSAFIIEEGWYSMGDLTGSGNILDQYIASAPTPQNALDIFKGEWSSSLPKELGNLQAGDSGLFDDARIHWIAEQWGGLDNQTILELGPLLTWQLLSMHQQMPKTPYLLDKSAFRLHSLLLPG